MKNHGFSFARLSQNRRGSDAPARDRVAGEHREHGLERRAIARAAVRDVDEAGEHEHARERHGDPGPPARHPQPDEAERQQDPPDHEADPGERARAALELDLVQRLVRVADVPEARQAVPEERLRDRARVVLDVLERAVAQLGPELVVGQRVRGVEQVGVAGRLRPPYPRMLVVVRGVVVEDAVDAGVLHRERQERVELGVVADRPRSDHQGAGRRARSPPARALAASPSR